MWIKIWRDSSAIAGRLHYAEYNNDEQLNSLLEYYDDLIEGDGYHVLKFESIDNPPKEWLSKQISRYSSRLKNLYKNYKEEKIDLIQTIKNYRELLKKK